jgi:hypothetical protein
MSTVEKSSEENQESKPVLVEKDRDEWIVKNEGDSAILFKSSEREPAVKFANDMAEQHGIEVKIKDRENHRDNHRDDRRDERRSEEEQREEKKEHDLILKESDGKWVVMHEEDTAVLFSASERSQAEKFARQMAEEHGVKLKID